GHAGHIAARSCEAFDQPDRDRINPYLEDDGDRRSGRLCRQCSGCATWRSNHTHLTADQIGCQCRQAIILAVCPAEFDRHVTALDATSLAQAWAKRVNNITVPTS